MDCVLMKFDFDNNKLTFAAANNPVWIMRRKPLCNSVETSVPSVLKKENYNTETPENTELHRDEITEFKADKMPVGKYSDDNPKDFTQQTIQLQKGDIVYAFTDGFADQFGGPKGKKFKYKQMEELILANCHKPMQEQREILSRTINAWKGEMEQVDDLLVIGVRII